MNLAELASALKEGRISIGEWETGMRQYIKEQYEQAMILAKGGRENITQSDWGYEGSAIKKQYQYLDGFAQDIINDPQKYSTGALEARMNLYQESAWSTLEEFQAREYANQGFTEERSLLGVADHCDECVSEAGKGWQEIGSLIPIGDRTCISNCHCSMEYRRLESDGSYTYG